MSFLLLLTGPEVAVASYQLPGLLFLQHHQEPVFVAGGHSLWQPCRLLPTWSVGNERGSRHSTFGASVPRVVLSSFMPQRHFPPSSVLTGCRTPRGLQWEKLPTVADRYIRSLRTFLHSLLGPRAGCPPNPRAQVAVWVSEAQPAPLWWRELGRKAQ